MTRPDRILDGILVVDLSRYLPGPFATAELLRLGARVVRLEAPSGDPLRQFAPGWHARLNVGKESVVCDLKRDPDLGRALCSRSDVVVEGFRPGVVERLGVGPDDLPETVVYCSIQGFNAEGPWARRVGHDINYLGLAGALDSERPALPPIQFADLAAGGLAAVSQILGGLYARERTGRGSVHRVSMADESHRLVAYRRGGPTPVPRFLQGALACYDVYRTADGGWLSVGALEASFFRRLTELLEMPELAARQFEVGAQDELRRRLSRAFAARAADDWMELFGDADVAVAPVYSVDDSPIGRPEPEPRDVPVGRDTAAWRATLGF